MLAHTIERISNWTAQTRCRSFAHNAVLALVWASFATSGLVFSEPCPTDVLMLGLIVLLPTLGMVRVTPVLAMFMLAWASVAALGLISAVFAEDTGKAITHTLVSLFLAGGAFMIAGFVAQNPLANMRLIFRGSMVAAIVAAACAFAGYFDLLSTSELFTKFGRASGTFKDPNVFGPFLVPLVLYALNTALDRPIRRAFGPLALAGFLALAVFLSFSRGAWINLIMSLGIYLALAFVTAANNARRQKILLLALLGAGVIGASVGGALQNESVMALVSERASVTQSYDVGPEGRFGGQEKATALILDHPLGIGAAQFAPYYHHEEAHNVYLSMTLATGWAGSVLYVAMVLATLALGFSQCFKRTPWQPLVVIAFAAFAANAAEGIIIDSDHWRHFWLLMAFIWGSATALPQGVHVPRSLRPARALGLAMAEA